MASWLVHTVYLLVACASLAASIVAHVLMREAYADVQLAMIWMIGTLNIVWPIAFLLQYRVDRTLSAYERARSNGKSAAITVIVLNVILAVIAAWILHKPLG